MGRHRKAQAPSKGRPKKRSQSSQSSALDDEGDGGSENIDGAGVSEGIRRFTAAMRRWPGAKDWKFPPSTWRPGMSLDYQLRHIDDVTREPLDGGPSDRLPPEPEVGASLVDRMHYWIEKIAADAFEETLAAHDWFVARKAMQELAGEIVQRLAFEARLDFAGRAVRNTDNALRITPARAIANAAVEWLAAELRMRSAGPRGASAHVVKRIDDVARSHPASLLVGLRIEGSPAEIIGSTMTTDDRGRWRVGRLSVAIGAHRKHIPAGSLENAVREALEGKRG